MVDGISLAVVAFHRFLAEISVVVVTVSFNFLAAGHDFRQLVHLVIGIIERTAYRIRYTGNLVVVGIVARHLHRRSIQHLPHVSSLIRYAGKGFRFCIGRHYLVYRSGNIVVRSIVEIFNTLIIFLAVEF